ncbi:MAG: hypothetical protein CL914_09960 [Deltaproteobacteria bacterium]|nr:hypothetical protein [Deltaproteobacteria bacterium]
MIDMNDLMKKAQELSQNMQKQQEELSQLTFDVSVGGEMVKMKFNGKMELLDVQIDPEVVDRDDVQTLQDLILSAVNEGIRQSQEKMQESLGQQMGNMGGGLNLQNFFQPKS